MKNRNINNWYQLCVKIYKNNIQRMKNWILCTCLVCFGIGLFAQAKDLKLNEEGQLINAKESDPAAKAILDKVKYKYDNYQSLEADFNLEIEVPEHPKEVQKGKIARKGDKYRFALATQEVISDGQALYVIMNKNKEVQINDIPDEDETEFLSPESIFTFYEKGQHVYFLVNEYVEKGRAVQQIEFKPLDKGSDYIKLRLTVDRKTKEFIRLKAFGKDGTRYTFTIGKLSPNKAFAANYFKFDKTKYPEFYIEDLRE